MQARRYMHEYGATSEDFGRVAVADRRHAATNPNAFFYGKPITLEDHQASRMIVDPLHLLDCCQESDGAVALVVVSAERARDLPQPPAYVTAAAQGSGRDQFVMTSYYRDDIGIPEMGVVGRELWRQSGLGPDDMPMAILYDHFTPYVLMQLEELGFCGRGEAPDFIADGAIEVGGRLPLNTHGGQLGEAYIHGMNGIAEAVRQVRGTSVNQVDDVAARAGHRRHRRPDQRADPLRLARPGVAQLLGEEAQHPVDRHLLAVRVTVACLRPGNSTRMNASPISRLRVSKRVPVARSLSYRSPST